MSVAVGGPQPKLTGRAAFLLVAVGLLALFSLGPIRAYVGQRAEITELELKAQRLEDANAKLRGEISRLSDPAELERLARECLGMVRAGETAFVRGGDAPSSAC